MYITQNTVLNKSASIIMFHETNQLHMSLRINSKLIQTQSWLHSNIFFSYKNVLMLISLLYVLFANCTSGDDVICRYLAVFFYL